MNHRTTRRRVRFAPLAADVGLTMNWNILKLILAVVATLTWIIYVLQTSQFTKQGFHVPSPDNKMSAKIMRVHKNPTFGSERTYYEISLFSEYSPEETRVKPILAEEQPLTIADDHFALTRDCIQWDMKKGIVIFDFGKTKIEKIWRK